MHLDNIKITKISDNFLHLIDTIKKHDDSIYFWIQGGALRRCLDGSLDFKVDIDYDDEWYWPVDIDIHYQKLEDGEKISKILVEKMGFQKFQSYGNNTFYRFFDIVIDLIKPYGWECKEDNFNEEKAIEDYFVLTNNYKLSEQINIKSSLTWAPFTIESIALDSEYNLFYHQNFSEDIDNRDLRYIHKDYKLIYDTIDDFCKNDRTYGMIKMFMDKAIIQTNYPYNFSLPKSKADRMKEFHIEKDKKFTMSGVPRLKKHMNNGYSIQKDEYIINKLLIGNLIDEVGKNLSSFKKTGWWQSSHYYGIVDFELKSWYYGLLRGDRFGIHTSMVDTYQEIIMNTTEDMNLIMQTNLKGE